MKRNVKVKLIISHSHMDEKIAKALVDYLIESYELLPQDIRCTSVPDNTTEVGKYVHNVLKTDLKNCWGIIALLSYSGLHSTYVKYELGAAWILDTPVISILGPQVEGYEKHLGPVKELRHVKIEDSNAESILATDIKSLLSKMGVKAKVLSGENKKLSNFIQIYKQYGNVEIDFKATEIEIIQPKAGQKVNRKINVIIEKSTFPENSFLWVVMGNTNTKEFWPKEHLSINENECFIQEGGNPAPGELGIWIVGVGLSGHRKFEEWFNNGTKHGKGFPPFFEGKVPGMKILAKADGLIINRK